MNLRILLSVLLVYRSNFQVLHWNASGHHFDKVHSIAEEYYNKLLEDADIVAEMLMRLDIDPVNYLEAAELVKNESRNFVIVESKERYDIEDFIKYTETMFNDILSLIEELLASEELKHPKNVGIKATLESMYNEYDLQARYINKRRS